MQFLRSDTLKQPRVIRIMPNTPCAVGEGAFAACKGTHATDEDLSLALEVLSPLGEVLPIPESLMDGKRKKVEPEMPQFQIT